MIDNYLDVINKMLAMFGFVSMAIIGDDHFTTGFQSPVVSKVYISGHILSSMSPRWVKIDPLMMDQF